MSTRPEGTSERRVDLAADKRPVGLTTGDGHAVLAIAAPPVVRKNPLLQSKVGLAGLVTLSVMFLASVLTMPWTLDLFDTQDTPPFRQGSLDAVLLPPTWSGMEEDEKERRRTEAIRLALLAESEATGIAVEELDMPSEAEIGAAMPDYLLGTDALGRSLFIRTLAGGGISIGIGLAAALISVTIGTLYGAIAAVCGGRIDAIMMRIVDVLYGLPYVLLVVLLAVAGDALIEEYVSKHSARQVETVRLATPVAVERGIEPTSRRIDDMLSGDPDLASQIRQQIDDNPRLERRDMKPAVRSTLEVVILLVAIGGVSWLTMARVIRGQVLSLKEQPFMEASRAMGVPPVRQFMVHLLPNLVGPIIVYTTLTVPQAILQESFLSFLGIGVKPPLPSWGNLAAEGLEALNPVRMRWWLIVFPCVMLGITLLSLNFVGEALRVAFDPKAARR